MQEKKCVWEKIVNAQQSISTSQRRRILHVGVKTFCRWGCGIVWLFVASGAAPMDGFKMRV